MSRFQIDFHCYLRDSDHARLSAAGVYYVNGRSEVGPDNVLRSGYARNIVVVEAASEDAAYVLVRDALGVTAAECSEWHVRELEDDIVVRQPPRD